MKVLGNRGFVFIDGNGKPFHVRMWNGSPWLFRWHSGKKWVSLRKISQTDMWEFEKMAISQDDAQIYHKLHWEKQGAFLSEAEKDQCAAPACDYNVGALLLAGCAVTGKGLGGRVFCCDACAEEWLDVQRA